MFQSLSGFLMSCNCREHAIIIPTICKLFQSLSGFLMSCNEGIIPSLTSDVDGFNPYRVF